MWIRSGEIWADDGNPGGDEQVGKAASIRFVNPDLPGRMVTIYAYPHAPEGDDGHDLENLGVDTATEYMICRDLEDPGSTEEWSTYQYGTLDTAPLRADVSVAESVAYLWTSVRKGDEIGWDGEPF